MVKKSVKDHLLLVKPEIIHSCKYQRQLSKLPIFILKSLQNL